MRMLITIFRGSCIVVKAKLLMQVHANKDRTNLAKIAQIWQTNCVILGNERRWQ